MDYLQEHGETDVVRTIGNGSLYLPVSMIADILLPRNSYTSKLEPMA